MPPGGGQAFEPRRDIDPVAEDVGVVDDDVAEVDADAQHDRVAGGRSGVARGHFALDVDGAAHGVDDAGELDEQAVADGLDDPPAMPVDLGVGDLAPDRLQGKQRPLLVLAHQPGIADDIGRQDRRQPAFGALCPRPLIRSSLVSPRAEASRAADRRLRHAVLFVMRRCAAAARAHSRRPGCDRRRPGRDLRRGAAPIPPR